MLSVQWHLHYYQPYQKGLTLRPRPFLTAFCAVHNAQEALGRNAARLVRISGCSCQFTAYVIKSLSSATTAGLPIPERTLDE